MFFEILLGSSAGYLLQRLYYEYVFVPYPMVRLTGVSALLPLVGALGVGGATDLLYRLSRLPFCGWTKGPFWNRGWGLSLCASAFLHVEGAYVASEFRLDPTLSAGIASLLAFLLAWTWVRHLRYRALLATIPEESSSVFLGEIAKTKKSSSSQSSALSSPRRSSVDDLWTALDKEIRARFQIARV